MSTGFSLKWCKKCTKPSCEDGATGCPFKDSVEEYKQSISEATTPAEKERITQNWREWIEPTIRDCLRKRYFVWLKYCKEGSEELAQELFAVPCDTKYYFFPKKTKKTKPKGLEKWMK